MLWTIDYPLLKTIHIISSTLLFGTGLGTFFFMARARRSQCIAALRVTARTVVLADFLFTTPAVVIQLLTGGLLMQQLGISPSSIWFITVMSLFCFVGALWLPVVWMQLQMRDMLDQSPDQGPLPDRFETTIARWERLGYPAGLAMCLLFLMMVYKPFLHA